jgi:ribosomal protein S6--L-glutamate ligase
MTILSFHPCFGADRQVIIGAGNLTGEDLAFIRRADAIILPQGCSSELYQACLQSGAAVFPEYGPRFRYPGKIGQTQLFEEVSCSHPETYCWNHVAELQMSLENGKVLPRTFPFFLKMDTVHEGEGVFFIEDDAGLRRVLGQLEEKEATGSRGFLTQAAIATVGNTLRAVIIGRRIFTYWKRPAERGRMITNIGKGGLIDREWRPDLQEKAAAEAKKLSRRTGINLAAIDLAVAVNEPDPQPFFLEINYYFARRGLGGTFSYYRLLYQAVQEWLAERGLDPRRVVLF